MRLIDADMLLNSFKGAKKLGVDAIKYYVDNAPTIDLVRCGECKWGEKSGGILWCNIWLNDTNGLNFCSYAERRADEGIFP